MITHHHLKKKEEKNQSEQKYRITDLKYLLDVVDQRGFCEFVAKVVRHVEHCITIGTYFQSVAILHG